MGQIAQRREQLLRRTAALVGAAGVLTALAVLSTPPTLGTVAYWAALPFIGVAGVLLAVIYLRRSVIAVVGLCATVFAVTGVLLLLTGGLQAPAAQAIGILASGATSGAAISLLDTRRGTAVFWSLLAIMTGGITWMLLAYVAWQATVLIVATGWLMSGIIAYIVATAVPVAVKRAAELGAAHRAERQSSELEAQRRRSARLLHDTVLATLTLLAHSGVGVSTAALRAQARNDAHLLRQLRLGQPLYSLADAEYSPEPVEESTLGTTLESVRQRFDGLGLQVQWHGVSRVALPQAMLDAFLFSIAECLENVRRHAEVNTAHVTITEDEQAVRAMITDAGKGFAPDEVADQRLGLKESVVARLAEIGGSARVFSAPGAGTTVLLEVPR